MGKLKRKRLHKYLKKNEKARNKRNNDIEKEGEKMNDDKNVKLNNQGEQKQEEKEEKKGFWAFIGRHKRLSALALAATILLTVKGCDYINNNDSKIKDNPEPTKPAISDTLTPGGTDTPTKVEEPVNTQEPTNTDETPTMKTPTVTYSTRELTNDKVTVMIKSEEDLNALDGWKLSADKKALIRDYTENVNANVTVTAVNGAEASVKVVINNIDRTFNPAKVTYSTSSLTNGNVVVTIKADEEIQAVPGWELSADKKVLTKTFDANYAGSVLIKDLVGNTQNVNINIQNIDKTFKTPTVSYSTKELTNGNVEVTITSDEEMQAVLGWKLSEDKKSMTRIYEGNIEETTVTVKDLAGNAQEVKIVIQNIDKTFSDPTVSYSTRELTNGNVEVTITSDEEMQALEGWHLSADKKSMTKVYTKSAIEYVTVKDLAGNSKGLYIIVNNIDKVFATPTVTYKTLSNGNVRVTITSDEEMQAVKGWTLSEDKKSLIKDYSSNKEEKVTVKDAAGNSKTVTIKVTGIREYSSSDDNSYNPGSSSSNPGTNPGTDPGINPGNNPGSNENDPNRENQGSDGQDNQGVGGGDEIDDDDIVITPPSETQQQSVNQQQAVNQEQAVKQEQSVNQQQAVKQEEVKVEEVKETSERVNENLDSKDNQAVGSGDELQDDDIVVSVTLNQYREMRTVLETIKVAGMEIEYPVTREVVTEELVLADSHTLGLRK